MYERFTDRSRKVMQLANQEAMRFDHEYIGTEHILLGLVKEGSGVAANVLKNLDINLQRVRREVEQIVQHGPGSEEVVRGRLPHTPRAKKVIDYSVEEARRLNHNYIGTEHLLLGLLREEEGVAAHVLMNLGLKFDRVREEILNLLGRNFPNESRKVAAPLPPGPGRPEGLTDEELRAVRERIRHLAEQKDLFVAVQNFEEAARLRAEEAALTRLLAWYEWFRTYL